MRRHVLGISGLLFLAIGIGLYLGLGSDASKEFMAGSSLKSGLVLLAAWLAFPQLDRLPGWCLAWVIGGLLLLACRPRIVAILLRMSSYLVPLFVLIWILRRLAPAATHKR